MPQYVDVVVWLLVKKGNTVTDCGVKLDNTAVSAVLGVETMLSRSEE